MGIGRVRVGWPAIAKVCHCKDPRVGVRVRDRVWVRIFAMADRNRLGLGDREGRDRKGGKGEGKGRD